MTGLGVAGKEERGMKAVSVSPEVREEGGAPSGPGQASPGGASPAPTGGERGAGRIAELDGLRGMAILLVILGHYVGNAQHAALGLVPHRLLQLFQVGWTGVDLFFVLSGFLIGGILLDAREAPHYFRAFYMRRVYRILPVYYVWTLMYGALVGGAVLFFPGRFGVGAADLVRVPVQALFLQNFFIEMRPFAWMWFLVTWSLAVEEQFYLLAPPLIRFLSKRKLAIVLGATIVVAPFLRYAVFCYWAPGTYAAAYLMPCRADSLAWGVLLALGWRNKAFLEYLEEHRTVVQGVLFALALGFGGLLWWFLRPISVVSVTIGYTVLGMFYSCLVAVALSQKEGWVAGVMRWKWLGALGTISYCVYVIHLAFNLLGHMLVFHGGPRIYNLNGVAVTLVALGATLGVASVSWKYFEKPLVGRGHGYSYGESLDG
jgi:peptidoglycan/LPS O-acetylase OafA/YrhL